MKCLHISSFSFTSSYDLFLWSLFSFYNFPILRLLYEGENRNQLLVSISVVGYDNSYILSRSNCSKLRVKMVIDTLKTIQ